MDLDGVPVVVSVDEEAVLWTCDLRGGACVDRPLDLAAAGPEDDWYFENDYWEDDEECTRDRITVDAYNIASRVTVARLEGRPVVVTGGARYDFSFPDDGDSSGGIVRAWDPRTGRRIGKVMIGHALGVCSLTTVPYERGLLAVSSCEAGTLQAWDLATGARVADLEGSYNGEMGAALVAGRPVAVTGGHDDFLEVWDLMRGERLGQSLTGVEPAVGAVAIAEVDGRAVVVAAGGGGALHRWDLVTQRPIGAPMTGHTDSIQTLGTAVVAGRTVAVTGSDDGTTRVWDLARGEQLGDPFVGHCLQTVTEIAGTPVAVTDGDRDGIRLWDLALAAR
ncbi:hypothetical protein GCM10027168_20960 [Streptomyces capparidis]